MSSYKSLLGQTLEGRYRLEQVIGRGGQAVVCSGTDVTSGHVRAVKLLPADFNTPRDVIERFTKESLLLANLPAHPNIVKVFDGGYDEEMRAFYTVIEHVEGITLADLIDGSRKLAQSDREQTVVHALESSDDIRVVNQAADVHSFLTPSLSAGLAISVADALDQVHSWGLVHRDVKPSNILLGVDGAVKLTDFGIAQLTIDSGLTMTGMAVGTLLYMSPEQIKDLDLDGRADIYSLGVVLYACLAGHPPFADASAHMIPVHIVNTRPASPADLNAEVSEELQKIVLKALEKDPEDRYQTISEFQEALEDLVATGTLSSLNEAQLTDNILLLRGDIEPSKMNKKARAEEDSGERCEECGSPVPSTWKADLTACPACGMALDKVSDLPDQMVVELIRYAREKKNVHGKIGFDLAMYLYSEELRSPLIASWRDKISRAEEILREGSITMPPSEQPRATEMIARSRELMAAADYLTHPQLLAYNQSLPFRREAEALAASARGAAYQLLGRFHTVDGARAAQSADATMSYENARNVFLLATEQYKQAFDTWKRYETGEPSARIQDYYHEQKDQAELGEQWSEQANIITRGMLDFPHNRASAYDLFHQAIEVSEELTQKPGASHDTAVAKTYDGYYEQEQAKLAKHLIVIEDTQSEGRQAVKQAYSEDQRLRKTDNATVVEWLHERARISRTYFIELEDLPKKRKRIRIITPIVTYMIMFIIFVTSIEAVLSQVYSVQNPGTFWPGWPQILAQELRYHLDFDAWHHILILLVGLDLLICWPFNGLSKQQLGKTDWLDNIHPLILAPSQFLLPLLDGLYAFTQRDFTGSSGRRLLEALKYLARFVLATAPWVPVAILTYYLIESFQGYSVPNNYIWWLIALFAIPPSAGYFIGRYMNALEMKIKKLDEDERKQQETLNRKVLIKRETIQKDREQQAEEVRRRFNQVNQVYHQHRNEIESMLSVFIARLLHYRTVADFVDLPDLNSRLLHWREDLDEKFLRWMGLDYEEEQVVAVNSGDWSISRPLDNLAVETSLHRISLRLIQQNDGFVYWGTDGYENCRRQPLRLEKVVDGYVTEIELAPHVKQINFMFETPDHKWPGDMHTIWVQGN